MSLFVPPNVRATDANSNSLSGALWYFYLTGTTTPAAVYTTSARSVAHSNPVVADAGGKFANIFLDPAVTYRAVLKTAGGSTLFDVDPYPDMIATDDLGGSSGSGYVGFTQAGDGATDGTVEEELRRLSINPLHYGAVGDGVTDDLAACQRAANRALIVNGKLVFPSGYVFAVSGTLNILDGVRGVVGMGGVIKFTSNSAGIKLKGRHSGASTNVSECDVVGLRIDVDGQNCTPILAENPVNCRFDENHIFNHTSTGSTTDGAAISIHSYLDGLESASNCSVRNNIIEMLGTALQAHSAISIDAELVETTPSGVDDYWKANFVAKDATYPCAKFAVEGNRIFGGNYGISLSAVRYSTVTDNVVVQNTRAISAQNNCIGNDINDNVMFDFRGNACHLAYGALDNNINGNIAYSTMAVGEGVFQVYVAGDRNVFEGNTVVISGAGPQYHLYAAIHSNYNIFRSNKCYGTVARAYVAVESAWDNTVTEASSHAYVNSSFVNLFAGAASTCTGNAILGNHINGSSAVPAISILQVSDGIANHPNTGTVIKDNVVVGDAYSRQLLVHEETSGQLSAAILKGNAFNPTSAVGKFTLPRGRAHFADWQGNSALDTEIQGSTISDVASIAAGATATVSITVTGAVLGDLVIGYGTSAALPTGVVIAAATLTAADTAVLTLWNTTGGALDPPSMTYSVLIRKSLF